jgi:hypothetical protein
VQPVATPAPSVVQLQAGGDALRGGVRSTAAPTPPPAAPAPHRGSSTPITRKPTVVRLESGDTAIRGAVRAA